MYNQRFSQFDDVIAFVGRFSAAVEEVRSGTLALRRSLKQREERSLDKVREIVGQQDSACTWEWIDVNDVVQPCSVLNDEVSTEQLHVQILSQSRHDSVESAPLWPHCRVLDRFELSQ